jgi:hypothetical protein
MQFQVPQFIEVEDKIFGPLTFKQFVYMAGGAGAVYLLWRVLPLWLAGPLIICVGGFAAALAFMQWNGRPFILALESAFYYLFRSKLYLWNSERRDKKKPATKEEQHAVRAAETYMPGLSQSKLHELAWSLDIKERVAAGVAEEHEHEGGVMAPARPVRGEASFGVRTAREARI